MKTAEFELETFIERLLCFGILFIVSSFVFGYLLQKVLNKVKLCGGLYKRGK